MKKVICCEKAPGAIGPYSQAMEAGGVVYVPDSCLLTPLRGRWRKG